MKPLLPNLKYILPEIKNKRRLLLFLDYDGTLTPIVDKPHKALLSPRLKILLKKLIKDRHIIVSIVSGRSLKQVRKLIGLKGIYYAGCHGMEIEYRRKSYPMADAGKIIPIIKKLKRELSKGLRGIKGFEIEDKGIILTLHYRRVAKAKIPQLKKTFFKVTSSYLKPSPRRGEDKGEGAKPGKVKLAKGKKVLEIRPDVDWDKGKYCLWLMSVVAKRPKADEAIPTPFPIFIGDDKTDDDAFKVLRKKGITVFVKGEKKASKAQYYLDSIREVEGFLNNLLE